MLLSLLLLLSTGAWAETPKFTILGEGQCAQFEGVLFDKNATAEILARQGISATACDLKIKYALDKQQARYELDLGNIQIRYESLMKENNLLIEQKDLNSERSLSTIIELINNFNQQINLIKNLQEIKSFDTNQLIFKHINEEI